jgi:hypothetical protein
LSCSSSAATTTSLSLCAPWVAILNIDMHNSLKSANRGSWSYLTRHTPCISITRML